MQTWPAVALAYQNLYGHICYPYTYMQFADLFYIYAILSVCLYIVYE